MPTVAELEVRFGADTTELESGGRRASTILDQYGNAIRQAAYDSGALGKQSAAAVQGLSSLEEAIRQTTASGDRLNDTLERAGSSRGRGGRGGEGGFQGMAKGSDQARITLLALNRVLQDAPYGIIGVANNIDFLAENIVALAREVDPATGKVRGFKGALSGIASAFMGPSGILMLLSAGMALAVAFGDELADMFDGATIKADAYKRALEKIIEIKDDALSFKFDRDSLRESIANLEAEIASIQKAPGTGRVNRWLLQAQDAIFGYLTPDQREALEKGPKLDQLTGLRDYLKEQLEYLEALDVATQNVREHTTGTPQDDPEWIRKRVDAFRARIAAFRKETDAAALVASGLSSFGLHRRNELLDQIWNGRTEAWRDTDPTSEDWAGRLGLLGPEARADQLQGMDDLARKMRDLQEQSGATYETMTEGAYASMVAMQAGTLMAVDSLSYALGDLAAQLVTLELTWESMGEMGIRILQGLVAEMTTAIAKAAMLAGIGAAFGIGPGGSFASNLGRILFGGGRASGGFVSAGTSYLVGERGPELFTPGQSGFITPSHMLGPQVVEVRVVGSVTPGGDLRFSGHETSRRRAAGILG